MRQNVELLSISKGNRRQFYVSEDLMSQNLEHSTLFIANRQQFHVLAPRGSPNVELLSISHEIRRQFHVWGHPTRQNVELLSISKGNRRQFYVSEDLMSQNLKHSLKINGLRDTFARIQHYTLKMPKRPQQQLGSHDIQGVMRSRGSCHPVMMMGLSTGS